MPKQGQAHDPPSTAGSTRAALSAGSTRSQVETVSLLLAGSLCLLPFLLPYPQPFLAEWLAAALGVAAVLTALAGHGTRTPRCRARRAGLLRSRCFLALKLSSATRSISSCRCWPPSTWCMRR